MATLHSGSLTSISVMRQNSIFITGMKNSFDFIMRYVKARLAFFDRSFLSLFLLFHLPAVPTKTGCVSHRLRIEAWGGRVNSAEAAKKRHFIAQISGLALVPPLRWQQLEGADDWLFAAGNF